MQGSYVDSHLHLQATCFTDITNDLVARAESAGVKRMFCNAVTESDWTIVTSLSSKNPHIVPFVGIHPWFSATAKPGWQTRLADLLASNGDRTVGIGETGLDKIKPVNFGVQQQCFTSHLELAADLNLPVSIHCVKAWGPLLEIIKKVTTERGLPQMMVHSFNGSIETMKRLVDFGCFISYSCSIAEKAKLQDTLKQTPITALMLETDSPFQKNPYLGNVTYLTPDHNEPVAVAALYRYTADLLNINMHDFSSQLSNNASIFTNQTIDR